MRPAELVHNYRITVPGGIRCTVPKKGAGGVVAGVLRQIEKVGRVCYVRCEEPGLVKFTRVRDGILAEIFRNDSDLKPMDKGSGIVPWAQELITRVKGRQ